jgi:uncharacterized protein YdeI (YjbR/CyaY-like superfamily)
MTTTDPRVDAYIEKAQPFAQPILYHLRKLIHKANPEITETIKWGMPSFDYKGPYCSFASFKQHCSFGFWKTSLLKDPKNYLQARSAQGGEAMGNFGRITSLKDLPPDKAIIDLLKQAKKLNDEGVKIAKAKPAAKKPLVIPEELARSLNSNKKAGAFFNSLSPSHQREYAEWISEAKTETTRSKRLETTIEWLGEKKTRHWKYALK